MDYERVLSRECFPYVAEVAEKALPESVLFQAINTLEGVPGKPFAAQLWKVNHCGEEHQYSVYYFHSPSTFHVRVAPYPPGPQSLFLRSRLELAKIRTRWGL